MEKDNRPVVLVIDGQGGGIGKNLISSLKNSDVRADIAAAGTNAYALKSMLAAGADFGVGTDAIVECVKRADIIAGPIGIIVPNALKGEISSDIANAVASSRADKVLVPLNKCNIVVAGVKEGALSANIDEAVNNIKRICARLSDK